MTGRKQSPEGTFTVSGPGIDREYPEGGGPALSAAITFASRLGTDEATYYVRKPDGSFYARAENDGHGNIAVWRTADEETKA